MIAPGSKLLFWTGAIVTPAALLVAAQPTTAPFALLACALLLAITLWDLVAAQGGMRDLKAELPDIVRLSKDCEGPIPIVLHSGRPRSRRLRIGLPLPAEIDSPQEDMNVLLPADAPSASVDWPCTPRKRGQYTIERVYVELASPLSFWALRTHRPVQAELRVYPNLASERRRLSALFLNRGMFGIHAQRQLGKGREFEKLRDYIPGDSYDEIHWKATAKRGRPITKVFQVERTQEVYVVVDASRLSARAVPFSNEAQQINHLDRFMTAALVLGIAAERQGDLFGMLTFSDRVTRFVRARNGKAHYGVCRDALYTVEAQRVTPDFDELASFIRTRLRRRALLLFLTALDDPVLAEGFVRSIDMLRRHHLVLVSMITPPNVQPIFSQPDVTTTDEAYDRLGGHIRRRRLIELERVLRRRGVTFSLLDHERLSVELVAQYMAIKQRQML